MRAEAVTTEAEAQDLLLGVIRSIVDRPEEVRLDVNSNGSVVIIDVHVHDSDVGKALGTRGTYARALEVVMGAAYGKLGKRLALKVIAPKRRR
jgi:predicted RNA-binding protein YlqC (UPF0109 family)